MNEPKYFQSRMNRFRDLDTAEKTTVIIFKDKEVKGQTYDGSSVYQGWQTMLEPCERNLNKLADGSK